MTLEDQPKVVLVRRTPEQQIEYLKGALFLSIAENNRLKQMLTEMLMNPCHDSEREGFALLEELQRKA